MKNSVLVLSVGITLVFCVLLLQNNHALKEARRQLAAASNQRTALTTDETEQEAKISRLRNMLQDSESDAVGNIATVQALQRKLEAANASGNTNSVSALSKLFHDQAMQQLVKDEAKVGVARKIDSLFKAGLAQQLHLNDEQTATLKQLLAQKESLFWDKMFVPLMSGTVSASDMPVQGQAIQQEAEANKAQLIALLGQDGYQLYQYYDKTQVERDGFNQLNSQFGGAGQALTPDQQTQLLTLMSDTRYNFNFQPDLSDPMQLNVNDWRDNFSQEKIDSYIQQTQQLNEQMLRQAQGLLTQDQQSVLQNYLDQRLQRLKVQAITTAATLAGY
jgi:hypothetical protein